MDKEQKENWINCWLQKFGDRDNETFHAEVIINDKSLNLILQYNYNFDGDQIDPSSWCISGFKNVRNNKQDVLRIEGEYYMFSGEIINHWGERRPPVIRFKHRSKIVKEIQA